MNTLEAFARAQAADPAGAKVFDWHEAARRIRQRKPARASAGLGGDWEYTGGSIYADGAITDRYTYLKSNWAIPELDLDGDTQECWVLASERPEWDADTRWPDSAIAILEGREP